MPMAKPTEAEASWRGVPTPFVQATVKPRPATAITTTEAMKLFHARGFTAKAYLRAPRHRGDSSDQVSYLSQLLSCLGSKLRQSREAWHAQPIRLTAAQAKVVHASESLLELQISPLRER